MRSGLSINPSSKLKLLHLWVFGWVLALLVSQTLGQLHAVKHVIQQGGPDAVAHAADTREMHAAHDAHHEHEHEGDGDGDGEGFLDKLFSSHGSASDCRLYDHLCDGQAVPIILAAPLPIVLPSRLVAIFAGDALARWAALFDARGPPLTF